MATKAPSEVLSSSFGWAAVRRSGGRPTIPDATAEATRA
jgi:hypothetical protein